ncbi:MAG: hypothetical protein SGBAC_004372 [Bacillariaceae sp.]
MKVTRKTVVVAATFSIGVDAFQIPLGTRVTSSRKRQTTRPSFTITQTPSLQQREKSLPFLSQIRSSEGENEDLIAYDENDSAESDRNGQHDSIVDQLSLEEQKELILRQLNMVDGSEDDSNFNIQQQDDDECFQSISLADEDDDYYNYYEENDDGSQNNDHFDDSDDNYYGNDDGPEGLSPRERRQRRQMRQIRHQRNATPSFGSTASELADTAIRIGGKAVNVAKKTTAKARQTLIENTFDDDWDDEEYESPTRQRRRDTTSPSNSRPLSRYARDRRRTSDSSPRRQRTRQRQDVDEFATRRPQDEQVEEAYQEQNYSVREDPNRQASRRPPRPIKKSSDRMEESEVTPQPPPRRRRGAVSNKRKSTNENQEKSNADDIDHDSTTKGDSKDPSWKSILEKTSKVASKKAKSIPRKIVNKAEKTAQKAKEISYNAVSNLLEDEEEEEQKIVDPVVMDAVIEDKKEERIVEPEVVPMEEWPSNAWSRSTQQPPATPNRSETSRDPTFDSAPSRPKRGRRQYSRRPRPRRPERRDTVRNTGVDQEQEQKYHYGLFQLPPAEESLEEAKVGEESPGAKESSSERTPRRRVYSPYGNQNKRRGRNDYEYYKDIDRLEITDGVDRMGNFVAEALDTFLYGHEDDEERPIRNRRRRRNPTQTTDTKTSSSNRRNNKSHKRSGHWKDRMEEQFDEFLGIHEGGKYYDRWANEESELENEQESNRKKNGTGRDPVSFARGKVGKRHTKSRPIWEEEDSLLSVLFGTDNDTVRRNARLYRSSSNLPFFGNGGSLVRVVQSMLQSVALVAGRVSQWASVHGSLPQPVIVVGLLSALLSARPGRRLQTVLFVTLALRMMGELLHGYMYDDLDFEDDLSVVSHKDGGHKSELDGDDFDGSDYM